MKGLYLNVPGAREKVQRIDGLLEAPGALATAAHRGHAVLVNYHREDWPEGPIHADPRREITVAASGWFIFRGRSGNLAEFAQAFTGADSLPEQTEILAGIDAGAFVILILNRDTATFVTDPFGLHPHYCTRGDPFSQVAPSPHFIKEGTQRDPELWAALERQDHLFGNLTAYADIRRLEPGAIITPGRADAYLNFLPDSRGARPLQEVLRQALALFQGRKRMLPISGGLDSRLLLACGDFDYGYTFGPAETGDRPVARRFAGCFADYHEFSLMDLEYPGRLREAGRQLLDGICARPFVELLPVYRHLHRRWGAGCRFFDGFGGDVLQRALYLTHGGIVGSLAKLFPWVTMHAFDPLRLLRCRYAGLSPGAADRLIDAYWRKTEPWDLDEPRKLTLFELLYGRGARYIINGGTILSGQYFTAVQPFLIPAVFRAFWTTDPYDALTYRALQDLWRQLPESFSQVPTYSGFKPVWHHNLARAVMLAVKGLGRLSVYRRSISYERERSRITWNEESR